MTDEEIKFYRECAIAAMQGIQESGNRLVSEMSDIFIYATAQRAFDLADAMLKEYRKRMEIKQDR